MLAVLAIAAFAVAGAALMRPAPVATTQPVPTTTIAPKKMPRLLVIGDSYSGGSNEGGNKEKGWPVLAQTQVTSDGSRLHLDLQARGGSGYVLVGPTGQNFQQALASAKGAPYDVVLVFGSINDQPADVTSVDKAARDLYAAALKASPKAELIVVGPSWMNDDPTPEVLAIRDVLRNAAAASRATFVDPIADKWFMGEATQYIGKDGKHPTDAGHVYMADRLAPVIKKAVTSASK
ncbi:SGNH/GDSL hydrolase family protein [Arthrobacter globiformis]|uniref:SGNH/GDSL hydrolase family protein n=1 Tax=Arthrobacter globiformis TaxID=1665 RepID=A0A328HEJ3_ARTGO|nr:SGNH/GDSL hydrolase family protein [Arthrobacter globiformis]